MATHGRQQYFADEQTLSKERREFAIADDVMQKIDSMESGSQENVIEKIRVNSVELIPDQDKAVDITVPGVIDNLSSTSTIDALSAKQGKILYECFQSISSKGRFLSNWDCATGLPATNPQTSPYGYRDGDYYIVSNVASGGGTNYRPDGSQYVIGQASTTVEAATVSVADFYFYDGTSWILLLSSAGGIVVDSSLSTTSTNPVENGVITNELNKKYYGVVSNAAPTNPTVGMIWYDTTTGDFNTYAGGSWVRKLDLGLNKVFDSSVVEIGKWVHGGGADSSGHHVTLNPNGEMSTYNVTVAGHNSATLGSGTLTLLSNTTLGGDETAVYDNEKIVATDGVNTETFDFLGTGNNKIARLSDISSKVNSVDVLTKINTTSYTPTADYHPATKKYVDDNCYAIPVYSLHSDVTGSISFNVLQGGDYRIVITGYHGGNINRTIDISVNTTVASTYTSTVIQTFTYQTVVTAAANDTITIAKDSDTLFTIYDIYIEKINKQSGYLSVV